LFEVAFGFDPIVQLTAQLFATFEIDFVCATSDFLVTRWSSPAKAPPISAAWVEVARGTVLTFLFGFDDILISFFLVTQSEFGAL
jgi:hypothetical protein